MWRWIGLGLLIIGVAGCSATSDLSDPPVPLGRFALGHNVVVAPNLTKGPVSREAGKEEWIDPVKTAIQTRFGRYEGDKLYHIAVSLEGYILAPPGIPIVASPKSILIAKLTVWDDSQGRKLNDEPEQLTVIEAPAKDTFLVGSGYTRTKTQQIKALSEQLAKQIQRYLQKHPEWFDLPPDQVVDAATAAVPADK